MGVDKRYKSFWESTNYVEMNLHYGNDEAMILNSTQTNSSVIL